MSKKNPKLIKVGLMFIVGGALGMALPFISFGTSEDYQILQNAADDKEAAQDLQDQFINQNQPQISQSPKPTPTTRPDPNKVTVNDRLIIPKIGVDMPIFAGDSVGLLLKGGWLFPGTARPGQPGNSVIFGHRFRFLPPITNTFYSLDKVVVGDTFTVSWKGEVFNYRIKLIKIIEPTDFSVLQQGTESEMTLITCTPLWTTKQRLVVVGTLIP
jgi:sortase A